MFFLLNPKQPSTRGPVRFGPGPSSNGIAAVGNMSIQIEFWRVLSSSVVAGKQAVVEEELKSKKKAINIQADALVRQAESILVKIIKIKIQIQ